MAPENRTCQNCKNQFVIEPEDFNFYEKIQVPPPTFCPECRAIRRLGWRNEHSLFRRRDDSDGKEIIAGFPPEAQIKTYNRDYWWSDSWDALAYGRDYDFSRSFFDQYIKLMRDVPWSARSVVNLVNSDYIDQAGYCKNLYLCFNCDYVEDSAYVVRSTYVKWSLDLLQCIKDEYCYESVMVNGSNHTLYSLNCDECSDVVFSKNCVGCNHCFGCVNLRGKSYYIFNQPYSKEEYQAKIADMKLHTFTGKTKAAEEAMRFWAKFPEKFMHGIKNLDSSGEYVFNSKNARECYFAEEGENLKWIQNTYFGVKDSYDCTVAWVHSSQMYECLTCGDQNDKLRFCFDCWPGNRNLEYCISCHSSEDCFGCFGLRKKQYCIFNKQYSKEEYESLRARIVEQMQTVPYKSIRGHEYRYGEFFPPEFAPFAYNETMAQDFFPLSKEEAMAQKYEWRDPKSKDYAVTISAKDLPDDIKDAGDELAKAIIACEKCGKAYRIIDSEMQFYRSMQIPLPHHCVECRFQERNLLLNPIKLWDRDCMCEGVVSGEYKNIAEHFHGSGKCPNDFKTSYAPERPEIVYCEECYQQEVI
jgi:hypothetical protein